MALHVRASLVAMVDILGASGLFVRCEQSFVADSALLVLGEYLHHLSSLREDLPAETREEARIGADVIAASIQYSAAARDGLDRGPSEVRPLPVFAMVRSAIYGLIFLENVNLVRMKKDVPSAGRFVSDSIERWESKRLGGSFGDFDTGADHHERWRKLSQYVHIIPEIKKEGGVSYAVDFQSSWDSSRRSRHAGLPEKFEKEAMECLEWQARLSLSTLFGFRENHPHLFDFKREVVRRHMEEDAFPMCTDMVLGIPGIKRGQARRVAKALFHTEFA